MVAQFKKISLNYKWLILLFILSVAVVCSMLYFILLNPPLSPDHFTVVITEVSLCQGLDEAGKPKPVSNVFSSDEDSISICGHLRVNYPPVGLEIYWYNEDESIFDDRIFKPDEAEYYFSSTIKPAGEAFQEGNYRVDLIIGRAKVWSTKFSVKQP